MRYVRFLHGSEKWGIVDNQVIKVLDKDFLYGGKPTGEEIPFSEVTLMAPVKPQKVICVGLNYADHAHELDMLVPEEPVLFLKPPTSVLPPGGTIAYPIISRQVDFEGELAVVIGQQGKNIQVEAARQHIFGFTCANDVTARDLQKKDGQWTRAKSFDSFLPLGPWIETSVDPNYLEIRTYLNDEVKQCSNTKQLIFPVDFLVSYISRVMTLVPGDVILTGTPLGVGPMHPGDKVNISIEGIGELRNVVR